MSDFPTPAANDAPAKGRVCVIAARAGSKGLPDKNIRPFAGRPLIAHSIVQAVASGLFEIVAVTSDSERYRDMAADAGATLLIDRPRELAGDRVAKPPVLKHALQAIETEVGREIAILVDLQPTSPLRRPGDIAGALAALEADPALTNVVSVCETKASPYFTLVEQRPDGRIGLSKERPERAARRQDVPPCFELNGSIYVWRRQGIIDELPALTPRTGMWLMPEECGFDIDTPLDFEIADHVARTRFGW